MSNELTDFSNQIDEHFEPEEVEIVLSSDDETFELLLDLLDKADD